MLVAAAPGYEPPTSREFQYRPFIGHSDFLTKPILLALISAIVIGWFFYASARRASIVPGKLQFVGEALYGGVRNGVARDVIGAHEFAKYVPYLVTLFTFILVNNVFGVIPFIQFPTFSRIGYPMVLSILTWLIFNFIGIRRMGFVGYFKAMMFPPGVPKWIYILLSPIEFISTVLVRPLTLALRLFANMFAGHLLLVVFVLGGWYMLHEANSMFLHVVSPLAFLLGILLSFFELLVEVLQAYIFTLLTALYIAGALAEEH